ncbi:hypothetical protein C2S51_008350 [Perilla frutescens var. frutescens]|nr:hypothetical protein C2S51_008350 [Perilla frutescens var. frutescens]
MLNKDEAKVSSQMMPQHHHLINNDEDEEDMETLDNSSSKNERKDIFDTFNKVCRDIVLDKMSNFFYDNEILFYAAITDSYKEMVEEIRIYGPELVPTTMYELRVHLLKKKVDDINLQMLEYKKE